MQMRTDPGSMPKLSIPQRFLYTLIREFFPLLYHQFAWSYNLVAAVVSVGSWQKWVLELLPYLEGPRILEIGFGPGHLQAAMIRSGKSAYGLDESRQMVRLAQQKLRSAGIRPGLIQGDALCLPFAERSFNQVALTFPAQFILQPTAIHEIHRVLVDGGSAVMLPMAWITGQAPLEKAAAWVNRITGEAPEFQEESLQPLKDSGFDVSWQIKELDNSKILVVKMVKI